MSRIKLKNGGKPRNKAILGAAALSSGAILAAAGIQAAATASAAKQQAKAVTENAKTQAESIKQQSANNTQLQKESINFTRQQNQENRQQQQDIQTTLQLLAGQENMNDRMEANKIQVKYGGKTKRASLKSSPFYGGASVPFRVTDGGGVLPLKVDNYGYGLYELIGDNHEQSHKVPGGKRKTGVGIKFNDGSVVEGEGNGNSNQGELMYVTPNDAMFISKHTIGGFNPAANVDAGLHPLEAFAIQEQIKAEKGLNDDGSKKRKSLKKANFGGMQILDDYSNLTYSPINGTVGVASGVAYGYNKNKQKDNNIAKNGKRIRLKAANGTKTNKGFWNNYGGATMTAGANIIGAGLGYLGNMFAGRTLSKAYNEAGNIIADAYGNMTTIDENTINREDYSAPHSMAVIRSANTNINPQLERLRRNAASEKEEVNRNTLSSAARQQRLAGINDRMYQRMGEQYAYKHNADERIRQENAARITQVAQENAARDAKANEAYTQARLSLKQYNNDINNAKLAGIAQAKADATIQSNLASATAAQSGAQAIGAGITGAAGAFANAYDANKQFNQNVDLALIGADFDAKVNYVMQTKDINRAKSLYDQIKDNTDDHSTKQKQLLQKVFGFK